MLSRVANSIYWMNRYVERAENYARLISVDLNLAMDLPPGTTELQWRPLIVTTGDESQFLERYGEFTKKNVIQFMAFDQEHPNSIYSCLLQARENARTVREVISSELWRQINEMYLSVRHLVKDKNLNQHSLMQFCWDVRLGSQLFSGIMDATFSHTESYHFGNMGRFIERAEKTDRILDMKYYYLLPNVDYVGTPLDLLQWSALLKSASAFEMYRQRFGKLDILNIIRFLVLDRDFPRAMRYALMQSEQSMRAIVKSEMFSFKTIAEKEIGKLRSELDYMEVNEILKFGLHEYLDQFQTKLNRLDAAISETFFTHTAVEQNSKAVFLSPREVKELQ
ncbi:MAG: alpha-E domain-containing protein [Elusimicrobia bacterium]|nr:alpha-E domain-containing protein [Elusimicrobiota bacterium]